MQLEKLETENALTATWFDPQIVRVDLAVQEVEQLRKFSTSPNRQCYFHSRLPVTPEMLVLLQVQQLNVIWAQPGLMLMLMDTSTSLSLRLSSSQHPT